MSLFKSVLLIDDDSITNLLNEKIILKNEFADSVSKFTNAEIALHSLKEIVQAADRNNFPDAIFLDINMPEMDGWEFLEQLLLLPDFHALKCKVIMLSSSIDIADFQKSVSYSLITNFISKPLTPDKLRAIHFEENFKPYKTGTSG